MNDSFLETRQVVKRYANHTALDGVSIAVPEGQVFGLLGLWGRKDHADSYYQPYYSSRCR